MERSKNEVGVDVKKQYVAPEIEVIHLNEEARLLSSSPTMSGGDKMGFDDVNETDW